MKSIEFYDLPRPVQERFVAAAQASLAPAPLAIKPGPRYIGARWFVAAALGFAATSVFALQGFGNLEHPSALAGISHALVYCVGFTISFACLTRGLTLRDRALSLPFARATYLFPMGVVEATSSRLNVHSLADLRTVTAAGASLQITFTDGSSFDFPAQDQSQAEAAQQAVTESQERLDEATRADSVRHLAALDPLCRTNFPSPFSHDVPFKRPTSLWAVALLGMAVVSGAALGAGVWEVRNKLSARRLAHAARALDTTAAYRAYLARGGTLPEIVDVLLPRAELAEAKAHKTVAAIERYIEGHPDSKIQQEVAEALRAALLEALAQARTAGTLAALNEFAQQHPRHQPVAQELAEARHEVFRSAAAKAKALVVDQDKAAPRSNPAAFIEPLVAYVEKHGPKVELRFRSVLNKSYKSADNSVRKSAFFGGNSTLPSRHFGEEAMRRREALVSPLLLSALQSLFPAEIVQFELGSALPSTGEDDRVPELPDPSVPTLFVDCSIELSGSVVHAKPRGIFFGAGMFYETHFVLPQQGARLDIQVRTWRSPTRSVMRAKQRTTADVYEDLARRSLNMFLRRYLKRVLKSPPDVSVPQLVLADAEGEDAADKDDKEG